MAQAEIGENVKKIREMRDNRKEELLKIEDTFINRNKEHR